MYNPHPEDGISSSVKIGLNASLDADAVLFTVSDQPWLTSETICELIHVFLNTSKGIACVSCQGKWEIHVFLTGNITMNCFLWKGIKAVKSDHETSG